MDEPAVPLTIDEKLREVARTRHLAAALLRGAENDSDDVLQEARVAALASNAPRGAEFLGWIRGTVRHLALSSRRRSARRRAREEAVACAVGIPATDEVVRRLELQRELLAAVETLAEPIRGAIVRRYLDDRPPRVLAKESGVPLATVKTRLRRGLAQLREKLNRSWGEELGAGLLELASGATGAGTVAGAATGAGAVGGMGAIAMTGKAKAVVAIALLVTAAAATVQVVRRWHRSGDGTDLGVAARTEGAAASDGRASIERTDAAAASVSPTRDADVAATNAPPSSSRRARLGERRIASLAGRVVDEKGKGCGGVEVAIVQPIERELLASLDEQEMSRLGERHVATSTSDGSFQFDDLVRGSTFNVFADARDGRRARLSYVRTGGDAPAILTLQPTTRIEGVVVDARDGSPVAGAGVRVRDFTADRRQRLSAISDGAGRFAIADVFGDHVMLFAAAADGRCSGPCSGDPRGREAIEVKLEVGLAGAADGTVVDADSGAPIPDAVLRLQEFDDVVAARSDEAGAFRVRPARSPTRGVVDAVVTAPTYAPALVALKTAKEPDDTPPSTVVRLRRGSVAKGRVVARDGVPVAGAVVAATRPRRGRGPKGGVVATTGDDGSFRIVGIDPTEHHVLTVLHDDCAWIETPFPPDELTSREIDFGTLVVGLGALVTGVVTDEGGAPLAAAGVRFEEKSGQDRGSSCDARGRFELSGLPAGTWKVTATVEGFTRPAEATIEVHDDEIVEPMKLTVPTGLSIAGRVVDVKGAPSPNAIVVLLRLRDHPVASRDVSFIANVDADGRFRVCGLEPGAYRLEAHPNTTTEMRSTSLVLERVDAGTTDLEAVLPDGTFVTGTVVDAQGQPIIGACLDVIGADGKPIAGGVSTRSGVFRIPVPANGEFRIEVRVFDPHHPGPVGDAAVVASLDHVRSGSAPVTLVVGAK